ncbi:CFI-box-CTERM domain-containing protein [Gaetbulibacter sp. M240]|uniref:CFI-box-CTERM domain-containing protein n=1 Tax=Gaetbulibacter sp. M240 TaxID=3126511 RepID=UPI00374EF396
MKLLNDLVLRTRTKCPDFGDILSELGHIDVYGTYRPVAYYEEGIKEIGDIFGSEPYYKQGYITNLITQENSFNILFMKYKGEYCNDIGGLYISREDIIGFEVFDADNLEVIKDEEVKERMNYMWKKGGGVLGSVTGGLTSKLIKLKTESIKGNKFVLSFYDNQNKINNISLYVRSEYFQETYLFINTYFKNKLEEEAIKGETGSNSSCFIATACYKDYYSKEVIFFRNYRDSRLSKSLIGRLFIFIYYNISPILYKPVFNSPKTSFVFKKVLDKLHKILKQNH